MTVGKRIAELRAIASGPEEWRRELSQNELSALIGMSERYVGMAERGQIKSIGTDAACAICRVLGCSLGWLVSGAGTPPRRRRVHRALQAARLAAKR